MSRSQDLVETPSLNKCASWDSGHPPTTATPRGTQFRHPKTPASTRILSPREGPIRHFTQNTALWEPAGESLRCRHRQHSGPRGLVSRDLRCFATVVRSAGYLVSIGAKQSPSYVGGGLQKPEIPCYVLWFTNGLERLSRKFSRVLHLMVTSELVSINGGVF